jgi:hypothetical protein
VKANAKFSCYSEPEWRTIAAEVRRVSSSVDMIGLRDKLERLGRYYVSDSIQFDRDYGLTTRCIEARQHYLCISYMKVRPRAHLNAHKPALDCYFKWLLYTWSSIGGDWLGRPTTKAIRYFISACVRPVAEPKHTTDDAIWERLDRLDQYDRDFAAASGVARVGRYVKRKRTLTDVSFADLPSNANEL